MTKYITGFTGADKATDYGPRFYTFFGYNFVLIYGSLACRYPTAAVKFFGKLRMETSATPVSVWVSIL